ncbi:MAG: helix-turn-helix transcriptional regulator [Planctomycetes bacterium]|nr:helix-turn-helix transcriptional regulator [Planctomycetota bacterium]
MAPKSITLNGIDYVVLNRTEYDALVKAAQLPPLPDRDEEGNYPALEYARASIARDIILQRIRLGVSQAELARRAGIRAKTLNRIERGKYSPSAATMEKLDRALRQGQ